MGHDGRCGGNGDWPGNYGASGRLVSCVHENQPAEKGGVSLCASVCRRTLLLSVTSFLAQLSLVAATAAINSVLKKIRRPRRGFRADAVCADTDGCRRHRDEVLLDHNFHRSRHGSRMHSHHRIQYRRRQASPRIGAVYQVAIGRGYRWCCRAGSGGSFSGADHRHIRRGKRACLLHSVCDQGVSHLSMLDNPCLCQ